MWLTGRLAPDHKTIADFRKDNGTAIRKVCARFIALCRHVVVNNLPRIKTQNWQFAGTELLR
jgi:transposase